MNSNASKTRPRERVLRTVVLVATGAVILSSKMVLTVHQPPPPPAPTFSEQAIADAYQDVLQLRSAGAFLTERAPAEATGTAQLGRTVTLLTVQGQALFRPLPDNANAPVSAAQDPSPTEASTRAPASVAAFLADLEASAGERFRDADNADGGTARLLAAAGAGQLLAAEALAAAANVPLAGLEPLVTHDGAITPAPATASTAPTAGAGASFPAAATPTPETCSLPASPGLPAALAAVLESEWQGQYGYQVALPRLPDEAVALAETALEQHRELSEEAVLLLAERCLDVPVRAAGYTLPDDFLTSPAVALGRLEAGALPVYGDLVAFSAGPIRQWAVRALVGTAKRGIIWGADAGALPGLADAGATFPPLPQNSASALAGPGAP